jgi:hypothetical protein
LVNEFEREGKRKEGQGPNEDPRTREECRALEAKARKRKEKGKVGSFCLLFTRLGEEEYNKYDTRKSSIRLR